MKRLKILTHNAFWFQGAGFETDSPGDPVPPVMESLVGIYRALAADVLCLQEIQDEPTFARLAAALGMPGRHSSGGVLRQYGGATLWREGSWVCGSATCEPAAQRMWQTVEVGGAGAAMMVCNIHLPSSRQLGRGAGARRLEELAAAVERDQRPAVVAGDFNERPGGSVCEYMASQGYLDMAAETGRAFLPTGLGGGRGDYIWLDRGLRERVVEYGVLHREVMASPSSTAGCRGNNYEAGYLSDHFPLWVTLETG